MMERSSTNNNSPSTPTYRIPAHVFETTASSAPGEWSTLSNESLFSIHIGNNSFSGEDYFKSGELTFPQPPSPRTPSLPSPPRDTNQGGGGVVDIGKKAAETDKAYRASKDKAYYASKDEEEKSVASIGDVFMANKDNKTNKLDRSVSRQSEDFSVKSFAFPILRNADKGGLQGSTPQMKPIVISLEADGDGDGGLKKEEASKPVTPKAEADRGCSRYPSWLSCFPCCKTSYI
ncbi:hypothetical protein Rs2_03953 [Raphanus sativus]|nr:hypothetical protein Rs2_03953 [Raphanus sativus]